MIIKKKKNDRIIKKGPHFGDISLEEFALKLMKSDLSNERIYKIKMSICLSMAVALWLIQIRLNHTNMQTQAVEQLPSYKYIKTRNITSNKDNPVVVASSSIAALESFIFNESIGTSEDLEEYIDSVFLGFSSNSKYFSNINEDNYLIWNSGFISRHIGIFSSCPSTNLRVFNLPSNSSKWGITELLGHLGKISEGIEKQDFIQNLIDSTFVDSGLIPNKELIFNEVEIKVGIEKEVLEFDNQLSITRVGNISNSKVYMGDKELVDKYLTKVEALKFEQAYKAGLNKIVSSLLTKAKDLKKSDEDNSK